MKLAVSPFGHTGPIAPFNKLFKDQFNPCLNNSLKGADALILWGGTDIHPSFYKEQSHIQNETKHTYEVSSRDLIEWHLMREAKQYGIPIIGVCRGAQFLSVFAGGSIIQHVTGHLSGHEVKTYDGKSVYAAANHHQMMHIDETEYELLAWSSSLSTLYQGEFNKTVKRILDVDPEVVYFPEIKGFAIQPHPEWGPAGTEFNNWVLKELESYLTVGVL
jgi:GMP synthase-like glutamine amidotransferase